jgi:hypothetical protein
MPADQEEIERQYHEMGLETRHQVDKPGTTYQPHRHEGVRLFTITGSAMVRLDNEPWQPVGPGQELVIGNDQLHEAKVADEPWEYIFAATPEEMKRQGL